MATTPRRSVPSPADAARRHPAPDSATRVVSPTGHDPSGSGRRLSLSNALTVALALVLGGNPAAAQELRVTGALCLGVTAGPGTNGAPPQLTGCPAGTFSVALNDVRVEGSTVGLQLAYLRGAAASVAAPESRPLPGAAGALGVGQLGLTLGANQSFGPLGNVVFELDGDLRSDGLAQLTLGARGVLGPVAARLSLLAQGADALTFEPLAAAGDDRPSFGGAAAGLRLGLTGRLSRNTVLEADPELYLSTAGLSGRVAARLRLLRALGENELRVQLRAGATPGFQAGYGALGAGVSFPRGRAPDVDFLVHLGLADGRLAPGVSFNLAEDLGGGVRARLSGALEPYRLDVHPGRALASISLPVGEGTFELAVAGAFLGTTRPATVVVQTSYALPVSLP